MHCYVVLLMPNNVIEEEVCSCSLLLMTAERSTCYTKSHMLENNAAVGALSSLVCDTAMWLGKKLHTGKELSPILRVRERNRPLGNVISEWIYFSMGWYSSKEEGCSSHCSAERTFFLLYWPRVVMGLWNKFHFGWSGEHFSSFRGNLVRGLCCAEFEYGDLKIGLLVHIPVSEVFLLTVEVCWHGNSLNLALNAVSLAPGLPGLRTLLTERLSQGSLSAEEDALSCRWSWPVRFFSPNLIKPLRNFAF